MRFPNYILGSLCRIADLQTEEITISPIEKSNWKTGDYVAGKCRMWSNFLIESPIGRRVPILPNDITIGALGERFATLEVTGSWRNVGIDNELQVLSGGAILGKLTSKAFYIPDLISLDYMGHVFVEGRPVNMKDYVPYCEPKNYNIPTILITGTSMSAGKTMSARVIIRLLTKMGLRSVGAKLCGAGRYRDILSMKEAGASEIFDFVDVGLPSTIGKKEDYIQDLSILLSMIQESNPDVAVVEIGSSPLEAYNGEAAIEAIRKHVRFSVLCASDPYAVIGAIKTFDVKPDIISGPATNTHAGIRLTERLSQMKALNIIETKNWPVLFDKLQRVLDKKLSLY